MERIPNTSDAVSYESKAEQMLENYIKRLAGRTLKRQQQELMSFQTFLNENMIFVGNLANDLNAWASIRSDMVEAFIKHLAKEQYTASSINMRLHTIKTYSRLATQAGILDSKEYEDIQRLFAQNDRVGQAHVGVKKTQSLILTSDQIEQLLKQPDTPQGRRDTLLLILLLNYGLWPREIASLDRHAIDFKTGTLNFYDYYLEEKQSYSLDPETLFAAMRYLSPEPITEALFSGNLKNSDLTTRMTDRAIHDRIRSLGAAIGLPTLSPQDCHLYWEKHRTRTVKRRRKTRPDVFNRQKFEDSLRRQHVSESLISPIVSDFRILMPLLLQDVGEEEFFTRVEKYRERLQLGPQKELWQRAIKHIVEWAKEQITDYQETRK